jgi:hypothetical protein
MVTQTQPFVETEQYADPCELAHLWGKQDALHGLPLRGSAYFTIGDAAWHAYNDGYAIGLQLRKMLVTPAEMSELEFMDSVLDTLRAGTEPILRLTDEQLAEIEDEHPGADFTRHPFLY